MTLRTNRREFNQAIAGTALGMMSPLITQAAPKDADDFSATWIDAHSHIWTRDVNRFPLAKGKTVDDLKPASFTAEELLETAKRSNVFRVVLIQHNTYHGWDNSYLIDAAQRFPQQFRVVGMVDDLSPDPAAQMRKLHKRKVTGFRITSWIRGREKWLSGSGMASMWECGAKTGQAMCCLINPEDMPAVDRMCSRYPDTPVVIDHFARVGVDGNIREDDVKQLCRFARHKNVSLKISAYYALGKKSPPYTDLIPMIRRVYDAFGTGRLMWASDAPYQVEKPHTYQASIDMILKRLDFLSEQERLDLLRNTASRVFQFES